MNFLHSLAKHSIVVVIDINPVMRSVIKSENWKMASESISYITTIGYEVSMSLSVSVSSSLCAFFFGLSSLCETVLL
jgi:hypothetical protein